MPFPRPLLLAVHAVLALVAVEAPSSAAPSLVEQAHAYAEHQNLPIRVVPLTGPGQEGQVRVFVPVTEKTASAFVKEFTGQGVVLQQPRDEEHVQMAFTPTDVVGPWAKETKTLETSWGARRRLYAVKLSDEEKAHFRKDIPTAQKRECGGTGQSAFCMNWLMNGNVGPDTNISAAFGISRSTAPSNWAAKLRHKAPGDVVVIGVPVADPHKELQDQVTIFERKIRWLKEDLAGLPKSTRFEEWSKGHRRSLWEEELGEATAKLAKLRTALEQPAPSESEVIAPFLKATDDELMGAPPRSAAMLGGYGRPLRPAEPSWVTSGLPSDREARDKPRSVDAPRASSRDRPGSDDFAPGRWRSDELKR